MWRPDDPQTRESAKIRFELVPYTKGLGLDIGCGQEKAFPHFWGIDSNVDEQLFGIPAIGADLIVPTAEKLSMFGDGSMDFVFSSHLLEHIQDHEGALREWWRLIKPGGHLCLYLPHKDLYPNIGVPGANPDHKHDFLPVDIVKTMLGIGGWDLVRNEDRNGTNEYSFFQVYQKNVDVTKHEYSHRNLPDPKKVCALIRFGAYGDMIQASSVFPALKAEGWHLRVFTSHLGYEVCKGDPNVDSWVIQDQDQVPNEWMTAYTKWMRWTFGRAINLSGVIEGTLLPSTTNDRDYHAHWPKEARHLVCNHNYVETLHQVAGVPYTKLEGRFYPSIEEKLQASDRRRRARGPAIAISLSGSSVHKVWPQLDALVARLMLTVQDITVVMMGGPGDQMLEKGWEAEPRVWRRAGVWSIREAMAFTRTADVVIGGETGVMNAMALEEVPKLLFLSHSSIENLCRDWKNTCAFVGEAPCYPCHQLHYSFDYCTRAKKGGVGVVSGRDDPERGVAMCQELIDLEKVWAVLTNLLEVKHARAV